MRPLQIPPFVQWIISRLTGDGHKAYVVGGAVRDAYLNRTVVDWDVTTSASAEDISNLFHDKNHFTLKKGTVTIIESGQHVEVTSFKGNGFSIEDDLTHRDFTLNAMAFDPEMGTIIDPWEGRKDADLKRIRAVEDPESRFREDPLRLIRGIRLASGLGFCIEKQTLARIREMAPMIRTVAVERVRDEWMKILLQPKPLKGFYSLINAGLLQHTLPELFESYRKKQNHYHKYTIFRHVMETVDRIRPEPVLRLAALLHDIGKPGTRKKIRGEWHFYGHEKEGERLSEEILTRFKFSREIIRAVTRLVKNHMIDYRPEWRDAAVRRLIRRVGEENIDDLLALWRADRLAHGFDEDKPALFDALEKRIHAQRATHAVVDRLQLAIGGHEVMAILGIPSGPGVGDVLNHLLENVLRYPELNNKKELVGLLKKEHGI